MKNCGKFIIVLALLMQVKNSFATCSPIFAFVYSGNLEAVKQFKGDVNICNDRGLTPLDIACILGQKEIVISLIDDKNANLNSDGLYLNYACMNGHIQIVDIIIERFVSRGKGFRALKELINLKDIMACTVVDRLLKFIERYPLKSPAQISEYRLLTPEQQQKYAIKHPDEIEGYRQILGILESLLCKSPSVS